MMADTLSARAQDLRAVASVLSFMLILGAVRRVADRLPAHRAGKRRRTQELLPHGAPWVVAPVYEKCRAENPAFEKNRDFWRDWLNIAIAWFCKPAWWRCPSTLIQQWAGCGSA